MKPFSKPPFALLVALSIPLAGSLTSCSLFNDGTLARSHRSGKTGAATGSGRSYETIYSADGGKREEGNGSAATMIGTHPRVDAAKWFAESLRQEAYRLGSDRKTHLRFEGATGVAYLNSTSTGDCTTGTGTSNTRSRNEARMILTQRLIDWKKSKFTEAAGLTRADAADLQANVVAQTVAIDFSTAWIDYLQARDIEALAEGNTAEHREMLGRVKDKLDRGLQSQSDVDLVQGRYERSRSLQNTQELALADARVRFKTIGTGEPGHMPGLPRASRGMMAAAPASNWEVKSAQKSVRAAELDHESSKRAHLPSIDLELGARQGDGFFGSASADQEAQALLVARFDILDGGFRKAEKARTQAVIYEANANLEAAKRDVNQLYMIGDQIRRKAIERQNHLSDYVASIDSAIDAMEADFAVNKQPVLRMLDLKSERFEAKSEMAIENYNRYRGEYAMLAANGKLVQLFSKVPGLNLSLPTGQRATMPNDKFSSNETTQKVRPRAEVVETATPERTTTIATADPIGTNETGSIHQNSEDLPEAPPAWIFSPLTPNQHAPAANMVGID